MSKTQDDMPTPVVEPKAPSVVDEKPTFTGAGDDTGRALYEQALTYDAEQLERDAKKVKRKLDFIVLPIVSPTSSIISPHHTPDPDTRAPAR